MTLTNFTNQIVAHLRSPIMGAAMICSMLVAFVSNVGCDTPGLSIGNLRSVRSANAKLGTDNLWGLAKPIDSVCNLDSDFACQDRIWRLLSAEVLSEDFYGVPRVLVKSHPLKILGAVVGLNAVLVVDDKSAFVSFNECHCDKSMYEHSLLLSVVGYDSNLAIAAPVDTLPHQSWLLSAERPSGAVHGNHPFDAPYLPDITHQITGKASDRSPLLNTTVHATLRNNQSDDWLLYAGGNA